MTKRFGCGSFGTTSRSSTSRERRRLACSGARTQGGLGSEAARLEIRALPGSRHRRAAPKRFFQLMAVALLLGVATQSVSGQGQNNFFGSSVPGNVPSASNPPATGGGGGGAPGGGDYSDDEKRVQKKFKSSVQHAKELVAKGDVMMKKGESKHDDKMYKKGKILKEIGEKQLNELQANNPFPDTKGLKDKKAP